MATSLGDGVFGIGANETGIITHKLKYDYTADEAMLDSVENEVVGVTLSKEKVDIAFDGKTPDASEFSSALGAILTLVNDMPDFLQGSISAGTTYVQGVSVEKDKGEYNDISVKAVYYPALITV